MSRHNYTNPAFCQQSEFYPTSRHSQSVENSTIANVHGGGVRIYRSESTRSFKTTVKKGNGLNQSLQLSNGTPPKPGPKPNLNSTGPFDTRSGSGGYAFNTGRSSGRYALVPVEELSGVTKDRYAIVPGPNPQVSSQRFTKSQDNIDRYSELPAQIESPTFQEDSDKFTSLPPIFSQEEPRLKSAFSSDFGSKSFVLVDQKSNQRYAVVPTADDEEIVDNNHEIIQMHNGRTHRYAVIPTDEEETCLSSTDLNQINHSYSTISDTARTPMQTSTPQKRVQQYSNPTTPLKNPAATRKLHELLSTPRKIPAQRSSNALRSAAKQYQSQQIFVTPKQELSPQRLQYETKKAYLEARTTAVITPRVAHSHNGEEDSINKAWNDSYPQKVANATATLGVVSLMLILGSILNSGLCLYIIANVGRSFYLEFGLASAFAGVGLGILGYRSRHCEWLPNRSYISGYILVTVFCLLKCCGLLVLLAVVPIPGTPMHDVTTGVVLGLSTFTIFFIGLGVIGSYWCYRPPPDNRVNVY